MNEILVGAIAMASFVASLFFLRFWKSTKDRFFLYFAMSFFIEGFSRVAFPSFSDGDSLRESAFYLLRLIAYGLILLAILEKNRRRDRDPS